MKLIRDIIIEGNLYLGSTVTVTVVLDEDVESGDTVKITIEDPASTTKVDSVSMTSLTDSVFQYLYQSTSTDNSGDYIITIEATLNSKVIIDQRTFELVELST
jgi:hypothetical protein